MDLIGTLALWGTPLASATFASLAMAIGLSVDYVVHLAHAYVRYGPEVPIEDRIRQTYAKMGASVFNGGMSTFLGICLLSIASSPAFRQFFHVMFGIVVFGVIHGVFFSVACMSLIDHLRGIPQTQSHAAAASVLAKTPSTTTLLSKQPTKKKEHVQLEVLTLAPGVDIIIDHGLQPSSPSPSPPQPGPDLPSDPYFDVEESFPRQK